MLYHFFGALGKTPDEVLSQEVFAYAHSVGLSGKKPSSVTVGVRIACLSSFYRFLIRMEMVTSNPCDKLERPKATPAPPRGLVAADIQRLLAYCPTHRWVCGTGPLSWR
jgi:site-specific recombinase XerD